MLSFAALDAILEFQMALLILHYGVERAHDSQPVYVQHSHVTENNMRFTLDMFVEIAAELFANGEIVQRPPERQRRIDAATTQRNDRDRPRYNDRTRYVRRRESQR